MTAQISQVAAVGAGYLGGGVRGAFLCERYGSDAITVLGRNRAYVRDILTDLLG